MYNSPCMIMHYYLFIYLFNSIFNCMILIIYFVLISVSVLAPQIPHSNIPTHLILPNKFGQKTKQTSSEREQQEKDKKHNSRKKKRKRKER